MKPVIRNPVINNPWAPNMPNNFRGSHAATVRVTEPAHLNIKVSFFVFVMLNTFFIGTGLLLVLVYVLFLNVYYNYYFINNTKFISRNCS